MWWKIMEDAGFDSKKQVSEDSAAHDVAVASTV
jgi:hypothetical protein